MNLLLLIYAACLGKSRREPHIAYAIHQQISGYQKSTENEKKSVSFKGAKLWNSVKANSKQAASLSTFKRHIQESK